MMPKQPGSEPSGDLQPSMSPDDINQAKKTPGEGGGIDRSIMDEAPRVETLQEAITIKNGLLQPPLLEQYLNSKGEKAARELACAMEKQISNTDPKSPGIKESLLSKKRMQFIRKIGDYWIQLYHAIRQYQPAYLKNLQWDKRYAAVLGLTAAGWQQKAREEKNPLLKVQRIGNAPEQKDRERLVKEWEFELGQQKYRWYQTACEALREQLGEKKPQGMDKEAEELLNAFNMIVALGDREVSPHAKGDPEPPTYTNKEAEQIIKLITTGKPWE